MEAGRNKPSGSDPGFNADTASAADFIGFMKAKGMPLA